MLERSRRVSPSHATRQHARPRKSEACVQERKRHLRLVVTSRSAAPPSALRARPQIAAAGRPSANPGPPPFVRATQCLFPEAFSLKARNLIRSSINVYNHANAAESHAGEIATRSLRAARAARSTSTFLPSACPSHRRRTSWGLRGCRKGKGGSLKVCERDCFSRTPGLLRRGLSFTGQIPLAGDRRLGSESEDDPAAGLLFNRSGGPPCLRARRRPRPGTAPSATHLTALINRQLGSPPLTKLKEVLNHGKVVRYTQCGGRPVQGPSSPILQQTRIEERVRC